MSTVSLEPYLLLTFLLVPLFYFSFFDTYNNYPHIFLYYLLLLATSSFLLPTLSSSTFLHILLLVHYDATGLFLPLAPHSLVHKPSFLTLNLLLCYNIGLGSGCNSGKDLSRNKGESQLVKCKDTG